MRARRLTALSLSLLLTLGGVPARAAAQEMLEPPATELEPPIPDVVPPIPEPEAPNTEPEPPAPEIEEPPAEPEPPEPEDEVKTVFTAGELCAWLRSLGPEGGEVFLGNTIALTWEDSPYFDTNLEAPAIIHTGPYSLIYDGEDIGIVGRVGLFQVEGEGVDAPVLEIRGDQFFGSDWNEILARQDVTASGRDGQGGVAVRITSDSETRNNLEYYRTRGRIHAYGAGAVGLQLDVPARVNCLDIDVTGEDALAIDGPEGTTAFLCILAAEAGGRPAGAGVNTDSSFLPPETAGPRIDCRVGIDPQIPLGARRRDVETIVGLYDFQRYRLTDGNYVNVDLIYDDNFAKRLDTSVPGPVNIPVALPKVLQGLGLEGETDFAYRVWIRDPALPILTDISQNRTAVTFSTSRHFLNAGSVWDPATRLWRSDDGGASWTDVTDWDAVTWCAADDSLERFQLDTAALDGPISLVLENGAGWGNVVTLTPGETGVFTPGTGGDRDGGDREEQPGDDGGTHPGDDNEENEDHTGGGSSNDDPSGDKPAGGGSSGHHTRPTPKPQPDASDDRTPPQQADESASREIQEPAQAVFEPDEGLPLPDAPRLPAAAPKDQPAEAPSSAIPPAAGSAQAPLSIRTAPTAVPEPALADPAQPEQAHTAAAAPDAQTPSPSPVQPTAPKPAQKGGLALPALVLCAAGGLTALAVRWNKRRKR